MFDVYAGPTLRRQRFGHGSHNKGRRTIYAKSQNVYQYSLLYVLDAAYYTKCARYSRTCTHIHRCTPRRLGHHDVGLSYSLHCVCFRLSLPKDALNCVALMYEASRSLAHAHRPPHVVAERTSKTSCRKKDQRQKARNTPLKQCCAK